MDQNPFNRLRTYSSPTPTGGVTLDASAVMMDFIVASKMGGRTLEDAVRLLTGLWPEIDVELTPTKGN